MLDPHADRPLFRQLADLLRQQIHTGQLPAGTLLPSEPRLVQEHGIGRSTVRNAVAVLRGEGLITTSQGNGTRVRPAPHRRPVHLQPGDQAIARMPVGTEQQQLSLDDGIPVIEVRRANGQEETHPADRTTVIGA